LILALSLDHDSASLCNSTFFPKPKEITSPRKVHSNRLPFSQTSLYTCGFSLNRKHFLLTTSKKGDNTPSRPHRQANIVSVPDEVKVVPAEQPRNLASLLPRNDPDPGQRTKGRGLDLRDWLTTHGIGIRSEKPWQGGTLFVLDECPFTSSHRDGAFAVQFQSSAVYVGCQHASCGGGTQRWPELRDRFEPKKRDKRERETISNTAPTPSPPSPSIPPTATIEARAKAALRFFVPITLSRSSWMSSIGSMSGTGSLPNVFFSRSLHNRS